MKKQVCQALFFIGVIPLVIFIILDYLDIPSYMGLHVKSLNYDCFSAVLNAIVVITLYIITFIIVDRRQIKKDDNAKKIADILLLNTYKQCQEILELVNDRNILENDIVPKVDFNKSDLDSPVTMRLKNNPFLEHIKILDFATTGVIDASRLSEYYRIMELYKSYVSLRVTFFDIYKYKGEEHRNLQNLIIKKKNEIESLLSEEIVNLEKTVEEE